MYPVDLVRIVNNAYSVVSYACRLNGDENKNGGYLCIADQKGQAIAVFLVGKIPEEKKRLKYRALCEEKARRLAEHPEHISSWQSRDTINDQWGGAIKTGAFIFSFSGLPELWDEAIVLALTYLLVPRFVPWRDWELIVEISANPYAKGLVTAIENGL